ncbi:MAG: hypothetical protein Q8K98_14565 [Bacteroidota bacterium]|nr:hypothetical protein [Bacteroidota bacterium]
MNNNLHRILKKLRRVEVGSDFEMRLKKRLTVETTKSSFFSKLRLSLPAILNPLWQAGIFRNRIPAYSVSAISVVAIGIASYYIFIRTGVTPQKSMPVIRYEVTSPSVEEAKSEKEVLKPEMNIDATDAGYAKERNQKVEMLYQKQTDVPVRSPEYVSTPQVMEKVRSSTMREFADTLSIMDSLTIDTLKNRKP